MFLRLTCPTCCSSVWLRECTSIVPFCLLHIDAHTRTHIVCCAINTVICFNYLLHQSFSSAISQGFVCLGIRDPAPCWDATSNFRPSSLLVFFLGVHIEGECMFCKGSHYGTNDGSAVIQWMVLWSLQIRYQRFCSDVKVKIWFGL